MPSTNQRPPMSTMPGMSIRAEIDLRLEVATTQARNLAFEEAIAFLRLSGFDAAAEALDQAAFAQTPETTQ